LLHSRGVSRGLLNSRQSGSASLFAEQFFWLADFLLNLAGNLFVLASDFQVVVLRRSSDLVLDFSLYLMKFPLGLVLGTVAS
jgi:hypothetical protein